MRFTAPEHLKSASFFSAFLVSLALTFNIQAADFSGPLAFAQPLDALVKDHVTLRRKQAYVNYGDWHGDDRHQKAMTLLKNANPDALQTEEQKLAFWINAYNLLTVDLILSEEEKESIMNLAPLNRFLGRVFQPWGRFHWQIGGAEYSLKSIEHDILRPMDRPLMHFAINCASFSCPNLRQEAYVPSRIEAQLKDQTRAFLNNKDKGAYVAGKAVYVSQIFDWFPADFGGRDGIINLLNTYTDASLPPETDIKGYLNYNWTLNGKWD